MVPQNPDALRPLIAAIFVAAVIVLIADLVLLWRWIAYQFRLNRALSQYTYVFDEPPPEGWTPPGFVSPVAEAQTQQTASTPEATQFDISSPEPQAVSPAPGSEAETGVNPPPAPVAAANWVVVPRPFAKTWSLVHPFLAFQFVLVITNILAVIPGLMAAPFLPGGLAALTDQASAGWKTFLAIAVIVSLFIQNGLFAGVVAYFLRRYGHTWKDIGLGRLTKNHLLIGLGLGLAMFAVAGVAEHFLGSFLKSALPQHILKALKEMSESVNAGAQFLQLPGPVAKFLFVIGGAVMAPIGEEIFFRGFLYNALKIRHTRALAMVVSGLAFALVHASPVAIIIIFPMGMLLAYIYERTQSLWVTILMHAVNNGLSFLLLALYPELGR